MSVQTCEVQARVWAVLAPSIYWPQVSFSDGGRERKTHSIRTLHFQVPGLPKVVAETFVKPQSTLHITSHNLQGPH